MKESKNDTNLSPKITGMLVDFEVFEIEDILEFHDNEEVLKERVEEAYKLINNNKWTNKETSNNSD